MVQENRLQSQVESYQRLKKWYLMSPCLTLSILRYRSRKSGAIQEKESCSPLHLSVVAIEKRSLQIAQDYGGPTRFIFMYIYIYIYTHKLKHTQQPRVKQKALKHIKYQRLIWVIRNSPTTENRKLTLRKRKGGKKKEPTFTRNL